MVPFAEAIHGVHPVEIAGVFVYVAQFYENGHSHLQGVNPMPVVYFAGGLHVIDGGCNRTDSFGVFLSIHQVKIQVGLGAALVVCITHGVASPQSPAVFLPPLQHIVLVWLLRINLV